MIINLRGTSGSGKSTVVLELMRLFAPVEIIERVGEGVRARPLVYRIHGCAPPLYVFGSYESVCGGCDVIDDYAAVVPQLVDKYLSQGHVLFEGLLVSGTFGAIGVHLQRLAAGGHEVVVAFLDTPLGVCLDRVEFRRAQRGVQKAFNPVNTIKKFHQCIVVKRQFRGKGIRVVDIHYQESVQQIAQLVGYL